MKEIPAVVTVTCIRDLPLLHLQAQSIAKYLDRTNPIFILVNETDTEAWYQYFDQHIRSLYKAHDLTVLDRSQIQGDWQVFKPHQRNPWGVGWQIQQVLKLAIAELLDSDAYLLLDSQNFLIKSWSANFLGDKVPYRKGFFTMPKDAYYNYAANLELDYLPDLSQHYMSMCTPFYMKTDMVKKLIAHYEGIENFVCEFNIISKIKSEFMLYAAWLEKNGGIEKYHEIIDDYGHPMLRDSKTNFNQLYKDFLLSIGSHSTHAWVSVNHRSWGDMTDQQYKLLCRKLSNYGLKPRFDDYRATYIDYQF